MEEMDCMLCAFRSERGAGGGGSGGLPLEMVCDDLSMAAFTPDSMLASFGRKVSGTCSSFCKYFRTLHEVCCIARTKSSSNACSVWATSNTMGTSLSLDFLDFIFVEFAAELSAG